MSQQPAEGLPWPEGDAGALATAARQTADAEHALSSLATSLASSAAGPGGWRGAAASAFERTIDAELDALRRPATALVEASAQLHRLATLLEDSQREVLRLAHEVRDAESAAGLAEVTAQLLGAGVHAALALAPGADDAPGSLGRSARDGADHARHAADRAREHAGAVRARATIRAEQLCDEVRRQDVVTAAAVDRAAAVAPLGGRHATGAPSPAHAFGASVFGALSKEDLQQLAYFLAGVEHWDPDEGLLANDDNVRAVYAFYGQMWTRDHDLQWAGMANLVGPLFYAGWQDLYVLRTLSDGGHRTKYLTQMLGLPRLPGFAYSAADLAQILVPGGAIADLSGEELEWFERRFLNMQKQIFDDLAWKHAAYELGGIDLLRELSASGQLPRGQLEPFEDIATGLPERVAAGNAALLRREQFDIIQDDYAAIRSHDGPIGEVFSQALTWTAENPIPGGHAYRDDYHHNLEVPLPAPFPLSLLHPSVPTPIDVPSGNLADLDDRWRWIQEDMLPNYQELLRDPDAMQQLVDRPVEDRAGDWRKVPVPYPGG